MKLQLSDRLQFIANKVTANSIIADIGSDHAYLPCYLCLQHEDVKAIAGEVSIGPYEKSLETVKKFNLQDRVDVRLGDGLDIITKDDHVSEIIIAGMGGALISSILQEGKDKLQHVKRLILQPNNNELKLRQTLIQLGFILTEEYILEDNNLIYEILIAEHERVTLHENLYSDLANEKQLLLGPLLSKERSPVFIKKWKQEHEKLTKTIKQMKKSTDQTVHTRIALFEKRIKWIEEVIS